MDFNLSDTDVAALRAVDIDPADVNGLTDADLARLLDHARREIGQDRWTPAGSTARVLAGFRLAKRGEVLSGDYSCPECGHMPMVAKAMAEALAKADEMRAKRGATCNHNPCNHSFVTATAAGTACDCCGRWWPNPR